MFMQKCLSLKSILAKPRSARSNFAPVRGCNFWNIRLKAQTFNIICANTFQRARSVNNALNSIPATSVSSFPALKRCCVDKLSSTFSSAAMVKSEKFASPKKGETFGMNKRIWTILRKLLLGREKFLTIKLKNAEAEGEKLFAKCLTRLYRFAAAYWRGETFTFMAKFKLIFCSNFNAPSHSANSSLHHKPRRSIFFHLKGLRERLTSTKM